MVAGQKRAVVGHRKTIPAAGKTDESRGPVGPHGTRASHHRLVAAARSVNAQDSGVIGHHPAVCYDEPIARADVTDVQIVAIAPERTRTGDGRLVVAAGSADAQGTEIVLHPRAVAHDQAIERSVAADNMIE